VETRTESPSRPSPADGSNRSPEVPAPRRRLNPALLVVGVIALVAVLIFGGRWLGYNLAHETTDDAKVDADTVTVTSKISERVARILVDTNEPVSKGEILMRLDDTDERTRYAQVAASRAAQFAQVNAAQQNVDLIRAQQAAQNQQNSGSIAASQAMIKNAGALYASSNQQVDAAKAAVAQANAQLRAAQAQIPSAEAALAKARADFARTSSLVQTGDMAAADLDAQRAALAQAQAQYRAALDNATAARTAVEQAQARTTAAIASAAAAQAGIANQQGQLSNAEGKLDESSTPFRVSTQQAQVAVARSQAASLSAQLRQAQDQLNYTVIRSPIDGYIGEKNVEVGATVQPGQSLLDIIPSHGTYITANYKETQLGKIVVGAPVDVRVDTYGGTLFHGHVSAIAPASENTFSLVPAQNATGNFVKITQRLPVRVIVDNPPADKPLRVGMSVETSIRTK
jgi:membrane fusion protein (multidrug efflux system)